MFLDEAKAKVTEPIGMRTLIGCSARWFNSYQMGLWPAWVAGWAGRYRLWWAGGCVGGCMWDGFTF